MTGRRHGADQCVTQRSAAGPTFDDDRAWAELQLRNHHAFTKSGRVKTESDKPTNELYFQLRSHSIFQATSLHSLASVLASPYVYRVQDLRPMWQNVGPQLAIWMQHVQIPFGRLDLNKCQWWYEDNMSVILLTSMTKTSSIVFRLLWIRIFCRWCHCDEALRIWSDKSLQWWRSKAACNYNRERVLPSPHFLPRFCT